MVSPLKKNYVKMQQHYLTRIHIITFLDSGFCSLSLYVIVSFTKPLICWTTGILENLNNTHKEKLNSVQEFIEVKSRLLLIFSVCSRNQLQAHSQV